MAKHEITKGEYAEAKEYAKTNRLKRVDKRLQVIILRYEGKTDLQIAQKLGYHEKYVGQLCANFKKVGLSQYARHKYGGNNQSVDVAKEKEILNRFTKEAMSGRVVRATDIKRVFDEHRGKDTGRGYIYMLLKRHDWRMVMPRGVHPQKASDEDIESSKKLTLDTKNYPL